MEIFNNIIKVNNDQIMIIYDKEGEIWFKLKDILQMLDYTANLNKIYQLNINKNNIRQYYEIRPSLSIGIPSNFQKNTNFINETGLNQLLAGSNKPIAKAFMNKYFADIMPTIRKTGKYILKEEDKEKLDKINEKLNNYKKELEYYSNKYSLFFSIKKTNRVKKIKIS